MLMEAWRMQKVIWPMAGSQPVLIYSAIQITIISGKQESNLKI